MEISKRLSNKIEEVRDLKIEITRLEGIIKDRDSMILGLTTENGELEAKVKKWELMQMNGYTAVAINNGYIMEAVTVAPDSTFTYTQDIPTQINTRLYNTFPFVKLDKQGKMIYDSQQFRKYKGVI